MLLDSSGLTMLIGLKQLNEYLTKRLKEREKQHRPALLSAGLYLQGESQKLCPVKTGALRNSARTRAEGTGKNTVVTISYSQSYAIFVHENLDAYHPHGQAKFLEEPARRLRKQIAAVYRRVLQGKQNDQ